MPSGRASGTTPGPPGCHVSEYVRRTLLAPPEPVEPALPPALVRRLARAVLILERLERARFEKQGGGDVWRAMAEEIDAWIEIDAVPE